MLTRISRTLGWWAGAGRRCADHLAPMSAQQPAGIQLPPDARRTFAEPAAYVPDLATLVAATSELRDVVQRFSSDRQALLRFYTVPGSPERRARLRAFQDAWLRGLLRHRLREAVAGRQGGLRPAADPPRVPAGAPRPRGEERAGHRAARAVRARLSPGWPRTGRSSSSSPRTRRLQRSRRSAPRSRRPRRRWRRCWRGARSRRA